MTTSVTLTWKLPTPTAKQRPIKNVEIAFRVKATPALAWTVQDHVVPTSAQSLVFADVSPGTYQYQVTVIDAGDVRSKNPAVAEATAGFDDPSDVANLAAVATSA